MMQKTHQTGAAMVECARCHLPIDGDITWRDLRSYHSACLMAGTQEIAKMVTTTGGQPICSKCSVGIAGDLVMIDDQPYHHDCLSVLPDATEAEPYVVEIEEGVARYMLAVLENCNKTGKPSKHRDEAIAVVQRLVDYYETT